MAQTLSTRKKILLFPALMLQIRKTNAIGLKREGNGSNSYPEDVRTLCKQGRLKDVLHIALVMDKPLEHSTYVCLLQGCSHKKALSEGKLVHAHMNERGLMPDLILWNALVNMYVKCGSLVDARGVFDQMPKRDVFSWTVMVGAYARHGFSKQALTLFYQMPRAGIQPNHFTFASVLPACSNLAVLKDIHEEIVRSGFESDVFVASALVDMYAKCGNIEKARQVFDGMPQRDVVSWNAMIAAYAQNGHFEEARELFRKIPERNVVSWNGMIAGYTQNGHPDEALKLFEKMPKRNVVSWNVMIAGYAQNGHGKLVLSQVKYALEILKKFKMEDCQSISSPMDALSKLIFLDTSTWIHTSY